MSEVEVRKIKKIVRKPPDPSTRRLTRKEIDEIVESPMVSTHETTAPSSTGKRGKTLAYAIVKPREVEGFATLSQLAAERGMQPQLARIWVKKAGMERSAAGWRWKAGSRDLKKVRKLLGLPEIPK